MGNNLTKTQKFWFAACILWLVFIFVVYRYEFRSTAWPALVTSFVALFPITCFIVSFARRRNQDRLDNNRHPARNTGPPPILAESMISAIMIPPEPRESLNRSLLRNLSVDSLVTFVYRKDGKVEENECVVCLSQLQQGELAARLRLCSHIFHEKCIDPWLRQHKTCPICRTSVGPRTIEESMVRHIAAVV